MAKKGQANLLAIYGQKRASQFILEVLKNNGSCLCDLFNSLVTIINNIGN